MSEKILGIYGDGNLGREINEIALQINSAEKRWKKIIFFVDEEYLRNRAVNGVEVFTFQEAVERYGNGLECVIGNGEPSSRKKMAAKLHSISIELTTIIYPGTHIPSSTTIGEGVIIQEGCLISCNATISNLVVIQPHCIIGHDNILGEGCEISAMSNFGGHVTIGEYSFVGLSASIREGITVGSSSVVSMGASVMKDVPDRVIVMGNPAKIIATIDDDYQVFKKR